MADKIVRCPNHECVDKNGDPNKWEWETTDTKGNTTKNVVLVKDIIPGQEYACPICSKQFLGKAIIDFND